MWGKRHSMAHGPAIELEREVKFDTPFGTALPDLRDLVGRTERLPQRRFSTVYFDTAGKRLWERGISLRYRLETGQSSGRWTLKLPSFSRGSARERTEVSWWGSRDTIPRGVVEVVRGVIRRDPLEELVELETTRQRLLLHDDGDRVLGEIDDDVVSILGGPRQGDRFRQVEFELAADERAVSDEVIDRFSSARMSVGAATKVAVALGLSEPGRREHAPLDRRSPVRNVLELAVSDAFEQILDHDWRLRLAAPDVKVEDVHRARVATRRLRSNLKTLQAVLDPVWTRHVRDDLRWVGSALGDIRDVDVLDDVLGAAPAELHVLLARDRATAVQRLIPVLTSERYLDLLDRLHVATSNPPVVCADEIDEPGTGREQMQDFVGAEWRALRRRVRKSGPEPSDRQLHRIRIGAKRLRYAAEMAEPVIGKPGRRMARAAEEVQTVLGEHHDAVAAEDWLRDRVLGDSGISDHEVSVASAFAAGCLASAERQTQSRLRRRWRRSWKALRRQAKAFAV